MPSPRWSVIVPAYNEAAPRLPSYLKEVQAYFEGRDDDTPDAIARRLELYHEQTAPLVELYRASGRLVPIRAERTIDEVANEIAEALDLLDGARA